MSDVAELTSLAEQLQTAADSATRVLETLEARLTALGLELETWVVKPPLTETTARPVRPIPLDLDASADGRCHSREELGYGRHDGRWMLLVRTRWFVENRTKGGFQAYEDLAARMVLLESERRLRLKAVSLLPELLDQIKEQVAQTVKAIDRARVLTEDAFLTAR
jgi:hypothetical protein